MKNIDEVDSRIHQYMEKRKSQQPSSFDQSTILFQDKAGLLNELETLRQKNVSLEQELKELLSSYDEIQREEQIKRLEQEKAEIIQIELEQLKQMHLKMREEYQQQVDFLQKQLDLAEQEKIKLLMENQKLKSNQCNEQETQDLYNKVFKDGQENIKFNKQIDRFQKEILKLKTIVETKITKKQQGKPKLTTKQNERQTKN
ncbi:unnamed protein product (macronuclear) [Paramecium tetraurelia]|uniref:Uncharacterized protein n=1 Tax=Paramecium tetraurelia TaxID=5888 RepID=A0BZN7_PARTE|nr:uncharacterized protein GSPATT00005856001 [Paramecium tetraurelia]CAK64004.1 unnamed protein product [Paramecium tetraurelia]|eukprot:XP_001431402.1 hypothetical protein (macronuclear) [Paramecium tetraurelia strain d4-2]